MSEKRSNYAPVRDIQLGKRNRNEWLKWPDENQSVRPPYFLEQLILTNHYQGFDPRKNVPRASWSSWDEMQKPLFLTPNVVSFWIIFTPYHFGTHKKSLVAYTYQFQDRLGHLGTLWLPKPFLQKSDKGQVFYWSSQTSTRFSRLVVTMLKKPQNCPISDFFILTPKYFLPFCLILTWNRLLLTQYHQVPTSTGLYWPITITYQPVPPYTDPLPPRTNQDRPILTRAHNLCHDNCQLMVIAINCNHSASKINCN